jgi:integrase
MAGSMRPGRRPGTWELRVELAPDPITHKRRWRSRTVTGNERQASRDLARLVVEVGGMDLAAATGGTVADLFSRWISHLETRGRERSTLYGYRVKWRLVEDILGPLPVVAVSPSRIDAIYDTLRAAGTGTGSIQHLHAMLRSMFGQAKRWRMIDSNPISDATPPSHRKPDAVAPTAEVVRSLIAAAATDDPKLAAFIRVSATLGTRRGETLALRWCDVRDSEIWVGAAISEVHDGRGVERKGTKTHAASWLPVDTGTVQMLHDLELASKRVALATGVPWNPEGYAFTDDPTGEEPWSLDHASKRFARLRATVPGAETVRLKNLRTYVATSLVDAGTDIRTAQARLRHASAQTTQAHYLARRKPAEDRAAEALGQALDG